MSNSLTARHATEEPAGSSVACLHGGLPTGRACYMEGFLKERSDFSPSRNEVHPNIVTNYDPKHVNLQG